MKVSRRIPRLPRRGVCLGTKLGPPPNSHAWTAFISVSIRPGLRRGEVQLHMFLVLGRHFRGQDVPTAVNCVKSDGCHYSRLLLFERR